ncbi:hypothetical protein Dsin_012447 [Dipteronia sinensis]|uniref:Uncharacterized protein n=1 Tax=Dipteronia sinensis TaxID=43782 RepID=A0AAE0AI38_9ROSI|nr:hypothetical protein Dsin_012447 [Dipteronia sinensis]
MNKHTPSFIRDSSSSIFMAFSEAIPFHGNSKLLHNPLNTDLKYHPAKLSFSNLKFVHFKVQANHASGKPADTVQVPLIQTEDSFTEPLNLPNLPAFEFKEYMLMKAKHVNKALEEAVPLRNPIKIHEASGGNLGRAQTGCPARPGFLAGLARPGPSAKRAKPKPV